ncbi:type IV pilin-like G/H family protein [Pseudanabaena sp. PCC 6802]|uniref:type IV pilin-like G/H family protein n=1 Tax=Pseudanabaena sp. PCC 6802 TaxID=118173 RepID=UPI0003780BD9|nr:type IV pilin-like G/H family protein [Pseudanabaena sp. PCC 6802]
MNSKHKRSRLLSWRYAGIGISSTFLLALAGCNSIPFAIGTPSPSPVASASPSPTNGTPSPSPSSSPTNETPSPSPSPSPTNGTPSPSPSPTSDDSQRELDTNTSPRQESVRLRQARARHFTGSLNRLSQRYFIQNERFTGDLDRLLREIGGKPNSENYDFGLTIVDEKRAVQTIVVAKRDGLKSYTGLAYVTDGSQTRSIVCESDRETRERPAAPEIANNEAKCPSGYTQLNSRKSYQSRF